MDAKISKFVEIFNDMQEFRQEWKIRHKLVDIIFISVVATVAGCDTWEEIQWFAKEKKSWFKKYIELPYGIPSHDTMERVFAWIEPGCFAEKFSEWMRIALSSGSMKDLEQWNSKGVIAIDGKTMRRTKDVAGDREPLHVVNAWFSQTGMVLGQVTTDVKSNEIKAIPELLDILDITGHIVTIDAMGTQYAIADKIVKANGNYVLALKGNQGDLEDSVKTFFKYELTEQGIKEYEIQHIQKKEKGHGRIETRDYHVTDKIDWLDLDDKWSSIKSIGMVKSKAESTSNGKITIENRYFISSLSAEVHRFAYAVRQHWGVESMHWSLDMTFNEDGRRSRKNNSAKNLAQLLRISYNIVKKGKGCQKGSLKLQRKKAMMNEEYLEQLITGMFEE